MNETKEFLKELISLAGASGHEQVIADRIIQAWQPYCDEIRRSPLGNIYGLKKGCGAEPGKKILIAAHMDCIGLIVHQIKGEFVNFATIGGFDSRILPGQFVEIHTKSGIIPGLIVQPNAFLLKDGDNSKPVGLDDLLIDTGMTAEEVAEKISVGDVITYAQPPMEMPGNIIAGHSLDDRASIAALTVCLRELQHIKHEWDVYAVATVGEETHFTGGFTSAFDIRPDIAIAVDVTFGDGYGMADWRAKTLESGPVLSFGMNIHPKMYEICKEIAERKNYPFTTTFNPGMSGTDADPLQISAGGQPGMVISIPLRYMHTPVEMIAMKDVMNVGYLISDLISEMDDKFMDKMRWEDEDED